MIKLLRIDDRLIHGQVVVAWSQHLDINCIFIASDSVANDEFRKMSLELVKPDDKDLIIKSIEDTIQFFNKNHSKNNKILILVEDSKDAYALATQIPEIDKINVGGMRISDNKKMISSAVAVDDEDIKIFKKLLNQNIKVEIRQVPSEKPKNIKFLI